MHRSSVDRKRQITKPKTRQQFSFSRLFTPKIVVGGVAALVVFVILFGGDIRRALTVSYIPRLGFAQSEEMRGSRALSQGRQARNTPIFDGEVYRTEGRLREASAVAIAATLAGVARAMERRPVRTVEELLIEIGRRNLLPPDVEFSTEQNSLVSERSTIHLRVRPEPFGVEVLSLGRERKDGAGLLVRVPDDTDEQQSMQRNSRQRYFQSFRLENITVPEAFGSATAVQAAGWQADYFDARLPDGANNEQLARWVYERRGQNP